MQRYERFGECLRQCLKEGKMSASAASRAVGFSSRNSIFRILSGEAGEDVNLRFLAALRRALGDEWPEERWRRLEEALSMDRLGTVRYRAYRAFERLLYAAPDRAEFTVDRLQQDGSKVTLALSSVLDEFVRGGKVELVITGCFDSNLMHLLADRCSVAGAQGRLTIRHYIDTAEETVSQHILSILPLISMPWYNARLVEPGSCPEEMAAIYQLNAIHIRKWEKDGRQYGGMLICYDKNRFASRMEMPGASAAIEVLDRHRFQLELLKPIQQPDDGTQAFLAYTEQYRQLEHDCTICSIKPDVHFNCISSEILEPAILEGFQQAGMAAGPELTELVQTLKGVHDARYANMIQKKKSTHLVYSLPAMERFMRTGVQTDHFFVQRAYTVAERRRIIQELMDIMRSQPRFNVYFLKEETSELRNEITFYEGKGLMMMDAYTGYELSADHSEAILNLPVLMRSFRSYFMEELLVHHVTSRSETLRILEGLLVMNIHE